MWGRGKGARAAAQGQLFRSCGGLRGVRCDVDAIDFQIFASSLLKALLKALLNWLILLIWLILRQLRRGGSIYMLSSPIQPSARPAVCLQIY